MAECVKKRWAKKNETQNKTLKASKSTIGKEESKMRREKKTNIPETPTKRRTSEAKHRNGKDEMDGATKISIVLYHPVTNYLFEML